MARYKIRIPKSVGRDITKVAKPWRNRVLRAIESLQSEPISGIKMSGRLKNCYKMRVWPYRIIYSVDKKKRIVSLLEVRHRGNVTYD